MGLGLALLAVQAVLVFNFDKHVGVAVALANTGVGVGLFSLPPLVQHLIGHLGWRGGTMILAAIYANICVCGSILVPTKSELTMRKQHRQHRHKTDTDDDGGNKTHTNISKEQIGQKECLEDTKDTETSKYECLQTTTNKSVDVKQDTEAPKYQRLLESSRQNLPESTKDAETSKPSKEYPEEGHNFKDSQITSKTEGTNKTTILSRSLSKLIKSFDLSLFHTNPNFIGYLMCGLFVGLGYTAILIYIAPKAADEGMSKLKASYIMSIVGIFQVCGRLLGGGLVDRKLVSPSIASGITMVLAGVFTCLFPVNNSFAFMATVAFLFGMSSGVYNCLYLLVAKEYVGVMQASGAFGWFQFAWAVGGFAGIYIQGE